MSERKADALGGDDLGVETLPAPAPAPSADAIMTAGLLGPAAGPLLIYVWRGAEVLGGGPAVAGGMAVVCAFSEEQAWARLKEEDFLAYHALRGGTAEAKAPESYEPADLPVLVQWATFAAGRDFWGKA